MRSVLALRVLTAHLISAILSVSDLSAVTSRAGRAKHRGSEFDCGDATDVESIVEPAREGDDGPGNLVLLLDVSTPLLPDSTCPLLLLDPAFEDVVEVAGADDLLRSGIEDGRVQEEWLSL